MINGIVRKPIVQQKNAFMYLTTIILMFCLFNNLIMVFFGYKIIGVSWPLALFLISFFIQSIINLITFCFVDKSKIHCTLIFCMLWLILISFVQVGLGINNLDILYQLALYFIPLLSYYYFYNLDDGQFLKFCEKCVFPLLFIFVLLSLWSGYSGFDVYTSSLDGNGHPYIRHFEALSHTDVDRSQGLLGNASIQAFLCLISFLLLSFHRKLNIIVKLIACMVAILSLGITGTRQLDALLLISIIFIIWPVKKTFNQRDLLKILFSLSIVFFLIYFLYHELYVSIHTFQIRGFSDYKFRVHEHERAIKHLLSYPWSIFIGVPLKVIAGSDSDNCSYFAVAQRFGVVALPICLTAIYFSYISIFENKRYKLLCSLIIISLFWFTNFINWTYCWVFLYIVFKYIAIVSKQTKKIPEDIIRYNQSR